MSSAVSADCSTRWSCDTGGVLTPVDLGGPCVENADCKANDDGLKDCVCDEGFEGDARVHCIGENDCEVHEDSGVVYISVRRYCAIYL